MVRVESKASMKINWEGQRSKGSMTHGREMALKGYIDNTV